MASTDLHASEIPTSQTAALRPSARKTILLIALAFSFFQVFAVTFNPLSSQVMRSVHVGFLLLLAFLLFSFRRGGPRTHVPWHDWLIGAFGFALGLYHWLFEGELIQRAGDPTWTDLAVGTAVIVLVLEAARRIMGWGLPVMCAAFIPYAMFGRSLPDFLAHRGYTFGQVVDHLFLGTEGIYGVPTYVSATFIFLFILFGALLERAGMIQLFNDVALGTVGHQKGGPAKVAVISSALMATINGSGVANVLTTGQFTIPLMIRFGYRRAFAGAVEATASMGGQIMPPVMGAVAFIMAETIGVPYAEIAIAAAIPAILYFVSVFWMVHLEAARENLVGLPKSQCPNPIRALLRGWYLVLPLVALVYFLFSGFTPLFAGTIGTLITAALVLGASIARELPLFALRLAFWILLGLLAALLEPLLGLRIELAALAAVAGLACIALMLRSGRAAVATLLGSMADAAINALPVGVACALVGILIGVTTLTGLAGELANLILALAGDNLFLALLMTMLACLILGTGLPTIPNYIITSAMAAPALLELGVPLIISHMFVFYFGIMADLTPPVALAALAAQSIAKESHIKIGFIATKLGVAGYVMPFMAVYTPALMLQGGSIGETAYVVAKSLLAIGLWGAAMSVWFIGPMSWVERIGATLAAVLLIFALPLTDEAGLSLAAAVLAWHWARSRRAGRRYAPQAPAERSGPQ